MIQPIRNFSKTYSLRKKGKRANYEWLEEKKFDPGLWKPNQYIHQFLGLEKLMQYLQSSQQSM